MRVCTAAQMRELEACANENGTTYETLMENAGEKAAEELCALFQDKPASILLLCGKGNNGGDALVIARRLAEKGWKVALSFLCGNELSPLAALNRSRLPEQVATLAEHDVGYNTYDCIVDGVFGIGFRGELPKTVQQAFLKANEAPGTRVALDLPSGMNCDTGELSKNTFCAHHTYTFGAYKPALLMEECKDFCGAITCLDIGL